VRRRFVDVLLYPSQVATEDQWIELDKIHSGKQRFIALQDVVDRDEDRFATS
jgi:hypothetical protein